MIVFVRLRPSSTWNSEMISASAGIIWMAMTAMMNAVRPRNLNRDRATAAKKATARAKNTTITVTMALLPIAVQK